MQLAGCKLKKKYMYSVVHSLFVLFDKQCDKSLLAFREDEVCWLDKFMEKCNQLKLLVAYDYLLYI